MCGSCAPCRREVAGPCEGFQPEQISRHSIEMLNLFLQIMHRFGLLMWWKTACYLTYEHSKPLRISGFSQIPGRLARRQEGGGSALQRGRGPPEIGAAQDPQLLSRRCRRTAHHPVLCGAVRGAPGAGPGRGDVLPLPSAI